MGVPPGETLLQLIQQIQKLPGLRFEGIAFYPGHIRRLDEEGEQALQNLAQTLERIGLPIRPGRPVYAARVEGKSSRARLGMLVHFSAPTIHSGFEGHLTLEVINLGPNSIQLVPDVYICQVVFERVTGPPEHTPSQFRGQHTSAGERPA